MNQFSWFPRVLCVSAGHPRLSSRRSVLDIKPVQIVAFSIRRRFLRHTRTDNTPKEPVFFEPIRFIRVIRGQNLHPVSMES